MPSSLLAFTLLLGTVVSPIWAASDVVGGYNATVDEYPYISFLVLERRSGGLEACTGSVIGARTILTAAHCVQNTVSGTARIGSSFSRSGGRQIETTAFHVHPDYNSTSFHYDIALLYTGEDLNVTRALLPSSASSSQTGQAVLVAGWGRTDANQPGGPQQVQQTLEQVDDKDDCKSAWAPTVHAPITREQICLTSRTFYQGSSLCRGDSGGPWVDPSRRYVLGVTSFGTTSCKSDERPNIGISTFETLRFIERNLS